ncbi:translocator protein-like [Haliotis rufescens]|uniref:translocator protein-like n=1 Tax=Haliotis rufescens TaxID=6454 RepID=UPI00201EE352|nr:translocator protein-like [Haliotis rufescens]
MSEYLRPAFAIVLPNLGGIAGGFFTRKAIPDWYEHLRKPSWRPPNYVFGPVWTYLYSSMGYASYLVWRDGGGFSGDAALPLACFGTQLALNWAWTPIFFGAKKMGLATIEIGALWGGIVATIITFHPVNRTASYLLIPYLAWVSLAGCLTYNIWRNNKDRTD